MKSGRPVMIMAGGTGGHIYPGLAVARALQASDIPVVWLGTQQGLEAKVIPEEGLPIAWLSISGLRGKGWMTWFVAPFRVAMALYQALLAMLKYRPATLLSMGGFVAGPGGAVGALMGKPLVIHEQNAVAGLTNKLLSLLSRRVLEGFPGAFKAGKKVQVVGNPVRAEIATLPATEQRFQQRFGQPIRLLVVGGSLGAVALNQLVPGALNLLPDSIRPHVWHQVGKRNAESAKAAYEGVDLTEVRLAPFIDDMAEAYAWADLVICRAGASTVAEVAAAGLAAIFVPYPYAVDDHQSFNADYLVDGNAAFSLKQDGLTAQQLAEVLKPLCRDRQRLLTMGCMAREMAMPDATEKVAAICAAYAGYSVKKEIQ